MTPRWLIVVRSVLVVILLCASGFGLWLSNDFPAGGNGAGAQSAVRYLNAAASAVVLSLGGLLISLLRPPQALEYRSPERPQARHWAIHVLQGLLRVVAALGFLWFGLLLLVACINLGSPDFLDPHPIGRPRTPLKSSLEVLVVGVPGAVVGFSAIWVARRLSRRRPHGVG